MPTSVPPHLTLLDELDARQDSVLAGLEELNERLESLLRELTRPPLRVISPEREAA
jgi:hypothetical protein